MTKYQLLPPLSEAELAALRDDIAAVGIRVPIDVDENGEVLDGHHRKAVALMLGVECPERVVLGLEDFEKVDYALTVNLARRHLDRAQRRTLVIASLKRDPRLSDREHARRCGVDHKTVASARGELQSTGEIPQSEKRTGADGRDRPAHQERQLADSASPKNSTDVDEVRPPTDPSTALPEFPGVDSGSAPAEQEEPRDGSPPADEPERAGAGVTLPAPDLDLVQTPIGPMPREFAEKLDQLVPDPNPHREWQAGFLKDVFAAAKAMRGYTGAEIAAKADDQLRAEFARFVGDMDSLLHETSAAIIAAACSNVRPLRRIQ